MTKEKLLSFEVVRTPKIRDSENKYVKRGETAMLTEKLADHYHGLGFIRVSMGKLFKDAKHDEPDRADAGTDDAPSDTGPESTVATAAAGSDDEGEASPSAESDTGAGEDEAGSGRASHRRRKRTAG